MRFLKTITKTIYFEAAFQGLLEPAIRPISMPPTKVVAPDFLPIQVPAPAPQALEFDPTRTQSDTTTDTRGRSLSGKNRLKNQLNQILAAHS